MIIPLSVNQRSPAGPSTFLHRHLHGAKSALRAMISSVIISSLLLLSLNQIFPEARIVSDPGVDYEQPQSFMNPVELEALFEVVEAISGRTDWRNSHPHPCSNDIWPGLVCEQGEDGLLHVTRLDFGYKPNPSCMVNASIPPAIGKLSSLQSLFIFECFTTVNTTIPSELKQLASSLQELSLRTNKALIGRIPPELGSLAALQVLSLSQNSLEGTIPAELGQLSSLEHLDLSYNMLDGGLPEELGNLRSLVILDISVNSLIGPLPPSLGRLSMIQKLDLSFNSFEGALPLALGNLRDLEFLAISNNLISGPFPDTFSSLMGLQYFMMDNNPMNVPLPKFLGGLASMLVLSLSNSGYFGPIPKEMGGLANLKVLSLDRNNLTGNIPKGLGELRHIYELNLSQNLLSGPVPFSPAFVYKLGRNLDLHGNMGLCFHWSPPENRTAPNLQVCAEPSDSGYSAYASSGGSSPLHASSGALKHEVKSAIYFGLISIACL